MAAAVFLKLCFHRLPTGIPYLRTVFYVEIMAACICGNIVVTISGQSEKACILIKRVASACVGNQRVKILAAQVIDPGERRFWGSNYVFFLNIIKMAKLHVYPLFYQLIISWFASSEVLRKRLSKRTQQKLALSDRLSIIHCFCKIKI
jgi:hypothetical protein